MSEQFNFFGVEPPKPHAARSLPPGFRYQPDIITAEEEADLLERIKALPFREFEFHGYSGKRRVVSFGWRYDYATRHLDKAEDMPDFLRSVRNSAANFAGLSAEALQHVLVTEYTAGSGIGWHKDKNVFNEIVGVSLLAPCVFRLRRRTSDGWDRVNVIAEPRSAYLMSGEARSDWEHSIPPVDALRYSITFRHLRDD